MLKFIARIVSRVYKTVKKKTLTFLAGFALAYNLGNFLRRLALPKAAKVWSLRTLRDKLIKIKTRVVTHSRYVIFQMA